MGRIVAVHGAFRLRRTGEGERACEIVHLSYAPKMSFCDIPQVLEENVIDTFYTVEDGLKRLCELAKN